MEMQLLVMALQRSLPSPSLSAAFSSYEHILPLETPLLSVSMTPTLLLFLHHILLCWAWMGFFFFCYAFLLDYPVLPNNFKYRLYTNISGFDFCPESQVCGSNSQLSIWHLHLEMYWDSWLVNMTTQNSQFSTCPQPTICPARCLLSVHFLRPVLRMHTRSIVFLSSFIQLFSRSWWDL